MQHHSASRLKVILIVVLVAGFGLFFESKGSSISGMAAKIQGGGCGGSTESTITPRNKDLTKSGCINAYKDPNYRGSRMKFCADGTQSGEFLDDEFSSIAVEEGVAVRVCVDDDGGGECRTYFRSVEKLGEGFDDSISWLEVTNFDEDSFKVIFASDPQLFWRQCIRNDPKCANDGGTAEEVGTRTNRNHLASMNALKVAYGAELVGGVMNGDLTSYGHDDELEAFSELYEEKLNMNLWPGLGNHDYQGNVDDCFENSCAMLMVDYMKDKVDELNALEFDWEVESGYKFPLERTWHRGSLAYSWEIGGYHFVQLQNFPLYYTSFDAWDWAGADMHHYDIMSSLDWLIQDLKRANEAGKKIVLNFHTAGYSRWGNNKTGWWMHGGPFYEALQEHGRNVVAIMVGHDHHRVGEYSKVDVNGRIIPVFWNGSAIYQHYILVSFEEESFTVWAVDSSAGESYQLSPSKSYRFSTE